MKKIVAFILITVMVLSLCGCGSSDAELKARIAELEAENAELKQAAEEAPTPTPENEGTEKKSTADGSQIEVECPEVIISNGYHIKVVDAYVKCLNTSSSTYDYDGMFLFFRGEIVSIDPMHEDWAVVKFDYYDSDGRYAGDVQVVYEGNLSDNSVGKTITGDGLLCVYDASKVVYNGESEISDAASGTDTEAMPSTAKAPSVSAPFPETTSETESYTMSDFVKYVENRMYSDKNLEGHCEVRSTDKYVAVLFSFDGVAEELITEALTGERSLHDEMDVAVSAMCLDLMSKAEEYKVNCNIMVALLNDVNPENTLISYIDGGKVSDYLD